MDTKSSSVMIRKDLIREISIATGHYRPVARKLMNMAFDIIMRRCRNGETFVVRDLFFMSFRTRPARISCAQIGGGKTHLVQALDYPFMRFKMNKKSYDYYKELSGRSRQFTAMAVAEEMAATSDFHIHSTKLAMKAILDSIRNTLEQQSTWYMRGFGRITHRQRHNPDGSLGRILPSFTHARNTIVRHNQLEAA